MLMLDGHGFWERFFRLISLSCPNQVIRLQLFVCFPFPSSFNGSINELPKQGC